MKTMSMIVVSQKPEETRMAVVSHDRLREYVVERNRDQQLVGSIFKGRVSNVVRGIQAAFVDIGKEQNGFLYLEEKEPISEGQNILVQVVKDARGTKGPAVTKEITLPGHYVVLQPFLDNVGLSKKISGKAERHRLKDIAMKHKPNNMGFVVRTAAEGVSEEEIVKDIERLVNDWQVVFARGKLAKAPQLLYRELDLSVRIVRDYMDEEVNKVIVDNETIFFRVKELLEQMPEYTPELVLYNEEEDVFSRLKLSKEIEGMSHRIVELDCGGYIVIDYTEAMTVIDVNSGKYVGKNTLEDTAMFINRQAALEIAHQLQLRDIGGIIVVDFIDMHTEEHQKEIMHILKDALSSDKMKPKVQDITSLNLVEITRRKARQNLSAVLYVACPVCQGTGRVESPETIAVDIRRRLRAFMQKGNQGRKVLLSVNPFVAKEIISHFIKDMQKEFSCKIRVESDPSLHIEAFAILDDGRN